MIVAMLRIKNEGRWIAEVLEALKPCCERLYVMDDHSTDDTVAIARGCGAEVFASPFSGIDESRDKDWLLRQIERDCPDGTWVLCIDGDEVLRPGDAAKVIEAARSDRAIAYTFRVLYLWNSRDTVRMDGIYGRFTRPSMFRLAHGATFRRTGAGGNFHCSSVPADCIGKVNSCDIGLLHLGYLHREDRIRKYEFYNRVDPNNTVEDSYRHVAQGDLPELPSWATFGWAGPLKLEPLEALCEVTAR